METVLPEQPFYFLQHGGGMGELTRHYNWSQTSIGTPDTWPQSLRITLSNLLHSAFPMFLFWGPDAICFYNDAYRPSLGDEGKHPAVGKAGKEVWPEIWDFIGPLIDGVMKTGEPVWFENQLVPIYRNGKLEDVYWTFSYSLALNDEGKPGGVLVTCMETTGAVKSRMQIQESQARFRNAMEQAPVAIGLTRGASFVFENINPPMLKLIGNKKAVDVIGKKVIEVLPELQGQGVHDILQQVLTTGVPFHGTEVMVELDRGDGLQPGYFNLSYTRLSDSSDTAFLLHMAIDVTGQVLARRKQEESEAKLRSILNSAPTAMSVFVGPDLIVENANQLMIEVMAAGPDIEGKSFRQLLSGLVEEDQKFLDLVDGVRTTGQPFEAQEVDVFFKAENKMRYFNISFIPLKDESDTIYAVLDVSVDVTEQVAARKKVEESEAKFRSLIEEAPVATCVFVGREMVIEIANKPILGLWGKSISALGKPLKTALPELEGQPFLQILDDVFTTGKAYTATAAPADLVVDGKLGTYYFDFTYKPLYNAHGEVYRIMTMAVDVTAQVAAIRALAKSESNLRNMILQAPVAMCIFRGPQFVIEIANEKMFEFWGKSPEQVMGKPLFEGIPEAANQGYEQLLTHVLATGEPFSANELPVTLPRSGIVQTVFINFTYQPLREKDGKVSGIMAMAIDVTEQVLARQEIEHNEKQLETALEQARLSKEAAALGTFDMDLLKGTMHWDDRCRTLFGISHNQPVTYEKDFVEGLHPDDRERILAVIEKSFIKAVSNGEYDVEYRTIGAEDGLERWVKAKGKVYFNEAETPIRFIGSVLDITGPMTAMQKIERTVEERTKELAAANTALQTANKELQRSNANLEEFAHAASHDLKEPIRKITFFTHQLKDQLADHLQEAEQRSFNRIENASERMGHLIDDLLLYSHVSQRPHQTEAVDLNEIVQRVMEDVELDIEEKKAVITVDNLPAVQGYKRQLQQLFQNLLTNALKYSKAGVPPVITITAAATTVAGSRFQVIKVADNGIGFEQQYADKIFQMFSRLHGKSEYSGTGVGLSIVKKVVENHNGLIEVKSEPGVGSTFEVYLPA